MNMKRSSCASGSGYVPSCSIGFCVAKTRNGSSSGYVRPPAVTRCSCIACRSAACVFGGVRLLSSARSTCANTGPDTKRNARRPVVWSSSSTSVPVMSLGIRSGVNWMRLKVRESASANVEMSRVFASPGTPTNRQWPREKSATRSCSITASWPTTLFAISWAMRPRARASSSISSASEAEPSAPSIASSLMMCVPCRERDRLALPLLQRRILESLRHLHARRVQVGVEWVHRDPVVERHPRFVQRPALEEHAGVQRLRRLVVRIALHRAAQRLFGFREAPQLHLRERVAAGDERHLPRYPLARAGVFLHGCRPAPASVEDLAQARGALSLLIRRRLRGGCVQGRRPRPALGVLLEDQLLCHRGPRRFLRDRLRAGLPQLRPPVRLALLEALPVGLGHGLLVRHPRSHCGHQLGKSGLPA